MLRWYSMHEYLEKIITTIIPGFLIAILTSIITVRLSIKQFYTQKWWEKKADTYSKIIEELSYLQYYFGELFDEGVQLKTISEEEHEELRIKFRESKLLIFKTYAAGAYIISDNSIIALKELIKELDIEKTNCHFVDNYDRWYGATRDCIEKIREQATRELT